MAGKQVLFALASLLLASTANGLIRGCYYTNWSQYRPDAGQFFPEDIDADLCSHIYYAFADMEGNRLVPIEWNDFDLYARVNALKETHPDLKTLLSVGGWNFNLTKMSDMLETAENRAEFIETSIDYLREHEFDGLDMSWEYPGRTEGGSVPEDKERFTLLLQEMRVAFDQEGADTGRDPLLMTAAVASGKDNIDNGYEIELIAVELDQILVMTYDLHGHWENFTGAHTALYPREDETDYQLYLNVEFAMEYWRDGGAPTDKLMMGIATYGRGYTLEDPNDNGMGAPATGPSPAGQWTREVGILAFYEVCTGMDANNGTMVFHDEHMVPYAYHDDVWISYESPTSLPYKMDFMTAGGYAGWGVWSLDQDDFDDLHCGLGAYPLLTVLNQATRKRA